MSGIKLVFGGATITSGATFGKEEDIKELYDVLEAGGCKAIDTAQLYGDSQELLGKTKAGDRFAIDTKWLGGAVPGSLTPENVVAGAKDSVQKLDVKKGNHRALPSNIHSLC